MKHHATVFALALSIASAAPALAQKNWPQFRGPGGLGATSGSAVTELGPEKNVAWKTAVPTGSSSPSVWGDRVFLTGFENGKLLVLCYAAKDGKELWRKEIAAEKIEEFHAREGSPAASTVATDGTHVVAYFGSCGLTCFDFSGKELWSYKLPVAETNNGFGSGTSPIIAGGKVFLVRDLAKDSAIHALDVKTGKLAWKVAREGFSTGYSTPFIWRRGKTTELIAPGGLRVKSYDPATGRELWTLRDVSAVNCTTPIASDSQLFFAGWSPGNEDAPMPTFDMLLKTDADADGALSKPETDGTMLKDFFEANDLNKDGKITRDEWDGLIGFLKRGQNRLVAIKPGGKGDITETHVTWEQKKGLPYVPSPVLAGGLIFLCKDGVMLSAYDAKTGAPAIEQRRVEGLEGAIYASPTVAGGHLYLATLGGKVAVLTANREAKIVSTADFAERIASSPAITDAGLFLRTVSTLYLFKKPKK